MSPRIYLFLLALFLAVIACATPVPGQQAPAQAGVPSATPFIAPSYPTAAAEAISPAQVVSGIDISVERAWQEGKQVYADVCYTLPDDSDWTIWDASLKYADIVLTEYGTTLLSSQA